MRIFSAYLSLFLLKKKVKERRREGEASKMPS